MKTQLLLAVTLIGGLHAQENPQSEPRELLDLRSRWQQVREETVKPVDEKYQKALEALKLQFTKSGNLEAALAVEKEIKSFKVESKKPEFPDQVLAHSWSWALPDGEGNAVLTFYPDKTGIHSHKGSELKFKWEVSGDRELTLVADAPLAGKKAVLNWNEKFSEYRGREFGMERRVSGVVVQKSK